MIIYSFDYKNERKHRNYIINDIIDMNFVVQNANTLKKMPLKKKRLWRRERSVKFCCTLPCQNVLKNIFYLFQMKCDTIVL